ncbi:MAG: hypothetical protein FWC50_02505 [Planctomycetaceae bacterium]|nr:hypothetical protein [Planctomycetaceae bacterium]
MMLQDKRFAKLLEMDRRYKPEAYAFVFESLDYAQNRLKMGKKCANEPLAPAPEFVDLDDSVAPEEAEEEGRHITGQDLAEAARLYALEMYGFMARVVLSNLGIRSTGDIGEIVYNMIKIGRMRKTQHDRREDFEEVYDFSIAFDKDYQIGLRKRRG